MWLTSGEVGDIAGGGRGFLSDDDRASIERETDARTGLCPEGHGMLIRARVEAESPFYLERCSVCRGIWFDRGEWRLLAENHLLGHLSDFWSREWQKEQRRKRSCEAYLAWQKESLGGGLFEGLMELAERLKDDPLKGVALAFLEEEIGK